MEAALDLHVEDEMQLIPVHGVACSANPRKHFDPTALQELAESIRAKGLIQPIVVRPNPSAQGEYCLIAGERRLRAVKSLGWSTIRAVVKTGVSEDEAHELATAENVVREDMSPVEEAHAIQQMVGRCGGDCAEAAGRLGKSEKYVRSRLQLLHCALPVQEALTRGRIKLGHAELLAGIPADLQEKTVAQILERRISVQNLKAGILSRLAQKLSDAKFETSGCTKCHKNSSSQRSLFDESIGSGFCQDRECWREKTLAWVAAEKARLSDEYPVIHTDLEKAQGTYAVLLETGERGVGVEQFRACRTCGSFGAILSTEPGREGALTKDLCFDPACHGGKVESYRKARESAPQSNPETRSGVRITETQKPGRPTSDPSDRTATPNALPKRVEEQVDRFYRTLATEIASENIQVKRALMLYAVLKDAGYDFKGVEAFGLKSLGSKRPEQFEALFGLAESDMQKLMADALLHIVAQGRDISCEGDEVMVRTAETIARVTQTDLTGRFTLTEEFLKAHTKAGIEEILRESGFASWWEKSKGPFKKLMDKKVEDLVRYVVGAGYDFSKYVPASVRKRLAAKIT